jgi:TPR repeat protein
MSVNEMTQMLLQAEKGDVDAQIYAGWAFEVGEYGQCDERAQYWYGRAASDSVNGKRRLARFLTIRNCASASEYIDQLLNIDDMYGFYLIGNCFIEGICGYKKDEQVGLAYMRKASEKGHIVARLRLNRKENPTTIFGSLKKQAYFMLYSVLYIYSSISGKNTDVKYMN